MFRDWGTPPGGGGGGPGSDTTAIHTDAAGEIFSIPDKPAPAGGDRIVLESAADGNAKRSSLISALSGGGDVTGPPGAVAGNLAELDATGKVISDSGVVAADVVTNFPGVPTSVQFNVPVYADTSAKVLVDSGLGTALIGSQGLGQFGMPNEQLLFYVDTTNRFSVGGNSSAPRDIVQFGGSPAGDGTVTSVTRPDSYWRWSTLGGNVTFPKAVQHNNIFGGGGGGTAVVLFNAFSDGEGNEGHLFGSGADAGENGWQIMVTTETSGTMKLRFVRKFATTDGDWETAGFPVNASKVHLAHVVFDDTTPATPPQIYIDGVLQPLTVLSTPTGASGDDTGQLLRMGNNTAGTRTFDGDQAVFMLYNDELTVVEALQMTRVIKARAFAYGAYRQVETRNDPIPTSTPTMVTYLTLTTPPLTPGTYEWHAYAGVSTSTGGTDVGIQVVIDGVVPANPDVQVQPNVGNGRIQQCGEGEIVVLPGDPVVPHTADVQFNQPAGGGIATMTNARLRILEVAQ